MWLNSTAFSARRASDPLHVPGPSMGYPNSRSPAHRRPEHRRSLYRARTRQKRKTAEGVDWQERGIANPVVHPIR
jgi:hypothetical protein